MELKAPTAIALLRDLPDGDGAAGGYADPLAHQRPFTAGHDRLVAGAPPRGAVSLPTTLASLYDVLMHQRNLARRETLLALPPGATWLPSARCTCMAKESAGYADIKMANIAIGPSKRNFIIIIPGFASRIV